MRFVSVISALVFVWTLFQTYDAAPWRADSTSCQQTADIVFLVDTSSSIWSKFFNNHVKKFLNDVVGYFEVGPGPKDTRVGMALFSTGVYLQFYLNQFKSVEAVTSAINRTRYRGGDTYTHKALEFANRVILSNRHGFRNGDVPTLVVVLTDGKSVDGTKTLKEANQLKARGVDIFAVGVGDRIDFNELKGMASSPSSEFAFRVTDFTALDTIKSKFTQSTCSVLTTKRPRSSTTTSTTTTTTPTTTSSTTTPTTTTTTPTTTTTTPTTTTTTPSTTTSTTTTTTTTKAPTTPKPTFPVTTTTTTEEPAQGDTPLGKKCRGKPADIYFLLDSSSSVWIGHFHDRVLPFVRDLVSSFHISPLHTRVGLVTFSNQVEHVFGLTEHKNLQNLMEALQPDEVDYLSGGTNTGDAIRYVTDKAFRAGEARRGVAHIVITITDGMSQRPRETARAASEAKNQGIYMFSVGVGQNVDDKELTDIASEPEEDFVFSVDDFKALNTITDLLALKACKALVSQDDGDQVEDKSECSKRPTNVVFAYDYLRSIPSARIIIQHVISQFNYDVMKFAPHIKVGMATQPCVGGTTSLMDATTFSQALSEISAGFLVGFPEIVMQLRTSVFSTQPLTDNRIAILILDEQTRTVEHFFEEVRKLKFKNVKVIVLSVGNVDTDVINRIASFPAVGHVIRVDSYDQLLEKKLDLLGMICDGVKGSLTTHVTVNKTSVVGTVVKDGNRKDSLRVRNPRVDGMPTVKPKKDTTTEFTVGYVPPN